MVSANWRGGVTGIEPQPEPRRGLRSDCPTRNGTCRRGCHRPQIRLDLCIPRGKTIRAPVVRHVVECGGRRMFLFPYPYPAGYHNRWLTISFLGTVRVQRLDPARGPARRRATLPLTPRRMELDHADER